MIKKKYLAYICVFLASLGFVYGLSRLYFKVTDGFRVAHISSDFSQDSRWDVHPLSLSELAEVDSILSQDFTYLGKGCQSYVFESQDGEYVLKFFKYQRFRPQVYYYAFSFLPPVKNCLDEKLIVKNQKRENLFASCKTAFDNLSDETGLVYVHLNKTDHLNKKTTFYDKTGAKHLLDMDQMEFMIQKKASMLSPTLDRMMANGEKDKAKKLISDLIAMVVSEYHRGYADNDHALIQNTGVYHGKPIHVDVGQFVYQDWHRNPLFYHQELFNKTWKFRNWLRGRHPELLSHVEKELYAEMGEEFYRLNFIPKVR